MEYGASTEIKITPYESEKIMSFRDFVKSSGLYYQVPVGFSTLYRSCILTFGEWFDLILGFKKIDAEERATCLGQTL